METYLIRQTNQRREQSNGFVWGRSKRKILKREKMRVEMTKKQKKVLSFIKREIEKKSVSPSLTEIGLRAPTSRRMESGSFKLGTSAQVNTGRRDSVT